ncbi:Regulator of chromosome condensation, RCC1 [Dillenia turbinata]|uniref:Regulator of chromosome condensation, RCC1 n=1 Tax=Dillenia turbinata TaxID=194707 RepID=A0AAN8VNX4_9MAGN
MSSPVYFVALYSSMYNILVLANDHSAKAISNGKLFAFGDRTFGVLGHGDGESVLYPKEVNSLNGLRTIKVACGVWHTIAIVEVMNIGGGNVSLGKLFTCGDGDKNHSGHGSKDAHMLPTCKNVEEIACGANHVAVLTSTNEVFAWGRGANGRLGYGDIEDQKSPTLVEALKDRHVKSISCGSNFIASVCVHKWVSEAVSLHWSSKKELRAALPPTLGKPHCVCDSCYAKLKASEAITAMTLYRKPTNLPGSVAVSQRTDRYVKSSRILLYPTMEPIKYLKCHSACFETSHYNYSASKLLKVCIPYSRRQSPTHGVTPVFTRGVIDSQEKSNEVLNQEVSKVGVTF